MSERRMQRPLLLIGVLLLGCSILSAEAQVIRNSRGVDSRVDYTSLTRYGPWDDRNYQLTGADLALLAPNEDEQVAQIPVFFRVQMRKAWPALRRQGPAQYPRSALQIFRQMYGGYLIDGWLYKGVRRQDGRWIVVETGGIQQEGFPQRFLAGEARVTSPHGAAESAIKINPADSNVVIAGTNGPGPGQKMHFSADGGKTWTQTDLPLGGTCCDPTVDWNTAGTLGHTATLGDCSFAGCAIWYYRSGDNGQTWSDLETDTPGDPRRELTANNSDKEFLHVDKYPGSPHQDNVYLTWHDNNVMQFARSTDDGNTWSKTSFSSAPLGIGSDITTDKSGNIYYFWPAFGPQTIVLMKSPDGGDTFGVPQMVASTQASFTFPAPSMETREVFVYVSADADLSNGPYANSVYVAWTDSTAATGRNPHNNHARVQVAYSRDGGSTWTVTTPHPTADANQVDRWHPWLAVGPDGSVHVIFYDTQRDASRASVDLFYTHSEDGAQTFSTPERLTAEQSPNIADSFEFGDYNGLDVVLNDLIAISTDNRAEGGESGDSVDVYAVGRSSNSTLIFTDGFESGDTSAWSRVVTTIIFADGFESGNTSAWSATIP